jgi:hypothetical protein
MHARESQLICTNETCCSCCLVASGCANGPCAYTHGPSTCPLDPCMCFQRYQPPTRSSCLQARDSRGGVLWRAIMQARLASIQRRYASAGHCFFAPIRTCHEPCLHDILFLLRGSTCQARQWLQLRYVRRNDGMWCELCTISSEKQGCRMCCRARNAQKARNASTATTSSSLACTHPGMMSAGCRPWRTGLSVAWFLSLLPNIRSCLPL